MRASQLEVLTGPGVQARLLFSFLKDDVKCLRELTLFILEFYSNFLGRLDTYYQ